MAVKNYTLKLDRDKTTLKLSLEANESGHAQAQASDICRALQANSYQLDYVETESTHISELFNKLAVNDFTYNQCFIWKGRYDKDDYP